MAFNARWTLEGLATARKIPIDILLAEFHQDLAAMVGSRPVHRLTVAGSGNTFILSDANGHHFEPPSEAGLYSIFSNERFLYLGEATDLRRRHLEDPDNTADSTKSFSNQGRAILKLILHRKWGQRLQMPNLFIQMYPASCPLAPGVSVEQRYIISNYSKSLEGAASIFIQGLHVPMVAQARAQGF